MSKFIERKNYKSKLSPYETQIAIGTLKRSFEDNLALNLALKRVSAPLFVNPKSGLNDNLSGVERPVSFDILQTKETAEVVQSLAKWKRIALKKYGFPVGEGIYTDMNAIRRDDDMDNLHSIYVDQWDWEKVIDLKSRNIAYLKQTVCSIVNAIVKTQNTLQLKYPVLSTKLLDKVSFITTQELENMYPGLSPKERENTYLKTHKTVFLMQIGDLLKSGNRHDSRAPDYDDWQLNGDILFYNELLDCAFEISSMGIRVDSLSLESQLEKANCTGRKELDYHKMLLENKLPLTIGGGIGQSRLSMLLLEKSHIGEVQVSLWDEDTISNCNKAGIFLL